MSTFFGNPIVDPDDRADAILAARIQRRAAPGVVIRPHARGWPTRSISFPFPLDATVYSWDTAYVFGVGIPDCGRWVPPCPPAE